MKNKRYNVFNQIHKGLRGFLYHTALHIQQTDFAQPQAEETVNKLEQLLHFFDEHAKMEDQYILPHVTKYNAQLVDDLEKDHVIDHTLTQQLYGQINEWKRTEDVHRREMAGKMIFYAFNEFIAFNLYHMNREENELMCVLWQHFSDAEIHKMEQEILKAVPPQILFEEGKWMMRSINNAEIVAWLSSMKLQAPAAVYNQYYALGQTELAADRWAEIEASLETNAVLN